MCLILMKLTRVLAHPSPPARLLCLNILTKKSSCHPGWGATQLALSQLPLPLLLLLLICCCTSVPLSRPLLMYVMHGSSLEPEMQMEPEMESETELELELQLEAGGKRVKC